MGKSDEMRILGAKCGNVLRVNNEIFISDWFWREN